MEDDAVIISSLCELSKVLACLWRMLFVELDSDEALANVRCALQRR